jgi:hypothetical protein
MSYKKRRSLIYTVALSGLTGFCLAAPHAATWGGRGQTEVKTETKRDVSKPLKDIPPKKEEREREPTVRPLRRIGPAATAAALPQELTPSVKHDVSPPLRGITPRRAEAGPFKRVIPLRRIRPETEGLRRTGQLINDRAEPTAAPTALVPANIERNFNGVGVDLAPPPPPNPPPPPFRPSGSPPDTSGVVGETQFVQWVNTSFAVFDKVTGTLVYGPADGNTLWTGFGGPCETSNDGDPVAQYDKIARRWVLSQFSVSGVEPNDQSRPAFRQCVAVSTGSDATGTYNRYEFKYDAFNDYPKMGVWPDGYYVTFNMFEGSDGPFIGSRVCVYDRDRMLAGQEGRMMCQQFARDIGGVLPSDLDGASATLNATGSSARPPAGSPNYLLNFGRNSLRVWKLKVDWAPPPPSPNAPPPPPTMSLTGPTLVGGVLPFNEACDSCVPQRDVTQQLDTLGDRLMFRLAYRRFPDGHEALVTNHAVTANNGSVGIRWYELRVAGQSVTLFQQGTFAPDTNHRWMGSIAMDRAGNIALGYNVSGNSLFPEVRFTGRPPGTSPPLGQMQGEKPIVAGGGSQTTFSRWGDYSNMSVDPVDDCTMWFTTEYLNSTGRHNWSTRVASFRFSSCQ